MQKNGPIHPAIMAPAVPTVRAPRPRKGKSGDDAATIDVTAVVEKIANPPAMTLSSLTPRQLLEQVLMKSRISILFKPYKLLEASTIGWIEKLINGLFNRPDSNFYGS